FRAIEHLARIPHDQDAFWLAMLPLRGDDLAGIEVAEVYGRAALLWNSRRKSDVDARLLRLAGRVIIARALDVGAVRFDHARDRSETIGLLCEVFEHVISDLVDQAPMRIRDLSEMRRIDHHLASVHDRGLGLV